MLSWEHGKQKWEDGQDRMAARNYCDHRMLKCGGEMQQLFCLTVVIIARTQAAK